MVVYVLCVDDQVPLRSIGFPRMHTVSPVVESISVYMAIQQIRGYCTYKKGNVSISSISWCRVQQRGRS